MPKFTVLAAIRAMQYAITNNDITCPKTQHLRPTPAALVAALI
jgi:hypothetical protein